jgi:hypothetical protein
MKAEEALNLSISSCKNEIESIYKEIEQSSKEGNTSLVKASIKGGTLQQLKEDGFSTTKLEITGERTIIKTIIKWNTINLQ